MMEEKARNEHDQASAKAPSPARKEKPVRAPAIRKAPKAEEPGQEATEATPEATEAKGQEEEEEEQEKEKEHKRKEEKEDKEEKNEEREAEKPSVADGDGAIDKGNASVRPASAGRAAPELADSGAAAEPTDRAEADGRTAEGESRTEKVSAAKPEAEEHLGGRAEELDANADDDGDGSDGFEEDDSPHPGQGQGQDKPGPEPDRTTASSPTRPHDQRSDSSFEPQHKEPEAPADLRGATPAGEKASMDYSGFDDFEDDDGEEPKALGDKKEAPQQEKNGLERKEADEENREQSRGSSQPFATARSESEPQKSGDLMTQSAGGEQMAQTTGEFSMDFEDEGSGFEEEGEDEEQTQKNEKDKGNTKDKDQAAAGIAGHSGEAVREKEEQEDASSEFEESAGSETFAAQAGSSTTAGAAGRERRGSTPGILGDLPERPTAANDAPGDGDESQSSDDDFESSGEAASKPTSPAKPESSTPPSKHT